MDIKTSKRDFCAQELKREMERLITVTFRHAACREEMKTTDLALLDHWEEVAVLEEQRRQVTGLHLVVCSCLQNDTSEVVSWAGGTRASC